jgi:hypothetical protein
MIDVSRAAKAIGIPIEEWPGNCHTIAVAFLESGVVWGKPVHGHWVGPVNPHCTLFYRRYKKLGFVSHSWLVKPNGSVVDPTRWVFENTKPYIFEGKSSWYYDEGGNGFRSQLLRPCPKYSEGKPTNFKISDAKVRKHLELLVPSPRWTIEQVFWLSNLSYDTHGTLVWQVYKAIEKNGHRSYVPIDNYLRAKREYYDPAISTRKSPTGQGE